jgi:hypothetical protein
MNEEQLSRMKVGDVGSTVSGTIVERVPGGWLIGTTYVPEPLSAMSADALKQAWKAAKKAAKSFPDHKPVGK